MMETLYVPLVPRRRRDHPARQRLRPARRGRDDRRGAGTRARPSRSPRCSCPSSSARRSARSPRARSRVPADPDDPFSSWTNASSLYIGALAVATSAYMAAVFLVADSVRAGLPDLVEAFRKRALGAGVVTGLMAIGGIFVIRSDAPRPLRRAHLGLRARRRDRLRARRRGHDRPRSGRAASTGPGQLGGRGRRDPRRARGRDRARLPPRADDARSGRRRRLDPDPVDGRGR